jgi:hypothetical protein
VISRNPSSGLSSPKGCAMPSFHTLFVQVLGEIIEAIEKAPSRRMPDGLRELVERLSGLARMIKRVSPVVLLDRSSVLFGPIVQSVQVADPDDARHYFEMSLEISDQNNPDSDHADSFKSKLYNEGRQVLIHALKRWYHRFQAEPELPRRTQAKPSRRTQAEVNQEIASYAKSIQRRLQAVRRKVETGEPGAIREARKLFGRNVLAEKLRCSAGLVSRSPAWQIIASELGIRGRTFEGGRNRIGFEQAEEEAAYSRWQREERV